MAALRAGRETDRAQHGGRNRPRSGTAAFRSRHRRHHDLARRGRIHGSGRPHVQVCTAAMHYGFKIVDEMIQVLRMDGAQGLSSLEDFRGRAVAR